MTIETNGIINNYTVAITSIVFLLLLIKVIDIKRRIIYSFIVGLVLFISFFIGWEYISYNHDSLEINKTLRLTDKFYKVNKIKEIFSSDVIRRNYANLLVEIDQPAVKYFYDKNYPNSTIEKVNQIKTYKIIDTFKVMQVGVLQFGVSGLEFYVVQDENGLEYVIYTGYSQIHITSTRSQ